MSVDFAQHEASTRDGAAGFIGRIPVRNLWLLILYASELIRQLPQARRIALEENPDGIPDLVAEILARTVERRLQRNLTYGYQVRQAALARVRGSIDFLRTERRQLLARGLVACRFDEFTMDTPRNRYVRAALETISRIVERSATRHRCRMLAARFDRLGVVSGKPDHAQVSSERLGHHDADDQQMLAAARLAFELALPTENQGREALNSPDRDAIWVRRLFEKAVAGFYDVVLSPYGWSVEAGKPFDWPIEYQTDGIAKILPSMRTDIVLSNPALSRRIVVDTKFTSIVTPAWFREESLRSGYMYQIYAYLRSQEASDALSKNASGLLLHPAIGEMIDEAVAMQGHFIRFATVDLGADASRIRRQLLHVVDQDMGLQWKAV